MSSNKKIIDAQDIQMFMSVLQDQLDSCAKCERDSIDIEEIVHLLYINQEQYDMKEFCAILKQYIAKNEN